MSDPRLTNMLRVERPHKAALQIGVMPTTTAPLMVRAKDAVAKLTGCRPDWRDSRGAVTAAQRAAIEAVGLQVEAVREVREFIREVRTERAKLERRLATQSPVPAAKN